MDECDQIAERKEIYETLHPETIARNKQGHVSNYKTSTTPGGVEDQASFVEDVSQKTGMGKSKIFSDIQIANNLTDESKKSAKELDLRKKEAIALARMDAEKQREAIEKRAAGEVKDIRELAKPAQNPKQETDPPPEPPIAEPETDWATRKKQIAQHVAELKDDSIDRSLTPDMVISEHDYFVRQTLLSFERYKTDLYRTAYTRMNEDEKEKVIALNNALLGAIKKNNIHLKG